MRQFVDALTDKLLPEDERELGIVKYDTSETPIEEAVAEADTMPFFASRKLVLIRDSPCLRPPRARRASWSTAPIR